MANTADKNEPFAGHLHYYDPSERLVAFESSQPGLASPASNSVIFIGGLSDGLNHILSRRSLVEGITRFNSSTLSQSSSQASPSEDNGSWSVIQLLLRSSYDSWGMGDIDKDAKDLNKLEVFLRETLGRKGKIVLLGHSTGCQDIIRYFQLYPSSTYAAGILQAPASDREAVLVSMSIEDLEKTLAVASREIEAGRGNFPLPYEALSLIYKEEGSFPGGKDRDGEKVVPTPISSKRWYSLTSLKKDGKEDYFSSDLPFSSYESNFAHFRETGKKIMFVISEKDEHVPDFINKEELLAKFVNAATKEGSDNASESVVLKDADHAISNETAMKDFTERVTNFLSHL